jgi:hypothetical protein
MIPSRLHPDCDAESGQFVGALPVGLLIAQKNPNSWLQRYNIKNPV